MLATCSILALVVCLLGYVFLAASGVVGLAHLAGISWVWTALAAAAAHFVVALILLLVARSQMSKPFFLGTLTELKEDREWVKNLNATSQPSS
jgi:Putative Actinobacterial Holin-X, holin superfamily III